MSPHRLQRPWQGKRDKPQPDTRPAYDPACYLCPGNERAGGAQNPEYDDVFVFTNDFAALLPDAPQGPRQRRLFRAETERVLQGDLFLPAPRPDAAGDRARGIRRVVDPWVEQYLELSVNPAVGHVQIFENKGALMGCSNPHPHGQIWATQSVPVEPAKEDAAQRAYMQQHGTCLLCAYLQQEEAAQERVVCSNEDWLAVVPFWAKWPFEVSCSAAGTRVTSANCPMANATA